MTDTLGLSNDPNMTTADWQALYQAGQAGGTAYLTDLAAGDTSGTAVNAPPPGQSQANLDADAILAQELTSWGFGQDAINWARGQIQSNDSVDQVLYSMRQQDFYKNSIFGQVMAARSKAGLPAMTEAQILSYKDYAIGLGQQAGLPQGFITDNELTNLMGQDVSTAELDQRITQGYQAAIKTSPDVLAQLQTYYGVTPGQLAAYYLDPQKALPLIQQQFTSAQIGAAATRTGYGAIDQQTAMGIAQLGKTEGEAVTGFTDLAKQAQLFGPLPGSNEAQIAEGVQIGAEFQGNAQDQQVITQRKEQRLAPFEGNFHFAETQNRGITGLGNAPRNG